MAHDDTEKAQLMKDILTAAKALASVVNNNQSLRVTFNPAALTSAATQSGAWNADLQGVGGLSMNDANLDQRNLISMQTFITNTVRS